MLPNFVHTQTFFMLFDQGISRLCTWNMVWEGCCALWADMVFASIERSLAGTGSNVDFGSMGSEQASLFLRLEEGLSFSYVMLNDEMLACECMIIISMKTMLEISNFLVNS